ncbi:hypothetical protein QN277_004884 [Acacia crassicarpa]|uniref:Uncharacterized protein n=1 Tax=Acacia crassicarpa TaxID=499986 RepID=A0AAE1J5C9_9FABA|nr:hypothetical protein QN277_004884 [Acacia crassicarpa]
MLCLFQVATWSKHNAKVNFLLLFGKHIISVDAHGGMFIWAFKGIDQNLAPFEHMKLDDKFIVSCKIHPDNYLNKVLIGSEQGPMQLWKEHKHKEKKRSLRDGIHLSCLVYLPLLLILLLLVVQREGFLFATFDMMKS